MNLRDALDQIAAVSDDQVIFARKPWTLDSDAEIGMLDEEFRVPASVTARGLSYFLEISVSREVLEVLPESKSTAESRRALVMFYAEYDAYPDWVYDE